MEDKKLDEEMRKLLKYAWRYESKIHVHKAHPTYCHVANQPGVEHYFRIEKAKQLEELGYVQSVDSNGTQKAWKLTENGLARGQELFELDSPKGPTLDF